MGKKALMFPGQGSQYVGMGKDFYDSYPQSKECFDKANEILGFKLSDMIFNGDIKDLSLTENTQPALLTTSVAMLSVLESQNLWNIDGVIGHSLGEYTAYVASKRLSFEDALSLTRKRGLLMSGADKEGKGGMAAILKMEDQAVEEILKDFDQVVAANYNCPGQLVISGDKTQIEKVLEIVKEKKGRGLMLPVSGAFHSPFMESVANNFENDLKNINFKSSNIPLYNNFNGSILEQGQEVKSLKTQLYSSVLFTQSVKNMVKDGFDTFIEVGSGKVLQGLVKKIEPSVEVIGIEKIEDLNR